MQEWKSQSTNCARPRIGLALWLFELCGFVNGAGAPWPTAFRKPSECSVCEWFCCACVAHGNVPFLRHWFFSAEFAIPISISVFFYAARPSRKERPRARHALIDNVHKSCDTHRPFTARCSVSHRRHFIFIFGIGGGSTSRSLARVLSCIVRFCIRYAIVAFATYTHKATKTNSRKTWAFIYGKWIENERMNIGARLVRICICGSCAQCAHANNKYKRFYLCRCRRRRRKKTHQNRRKIK